MKVKLVGDPLEYTKHIKVDMPTVALGDLSLGDKTRMYNIPQDRRFSFIYGDEDYKFASVNHDRCLGSFGYLKHWNMFFVSGSKRDRRSELNQDQIRKCIELYRKIQPRIVISHDSPVSVCSEMFNIAPEENDTTSLYDELLEIHKPQMWFFSHWKKDSQLKSDRTTFICLDSNSSFILSI